MMFRRKVQEEPKVDMTPMVDVVFLLLIFFMISTTFVQTPGINVNLPESSSQVVEKEPREIKVYIEKDGAIHLEDQAVSLNDLEARLAKLHGAGKDATFVLMADREVRHGLVVQVMDLAQQAGFKKLAIATEQLPPKP